MTKAGSIAAGMVFLMLSAPAFAAGQPNSVSAERTGRSLGSAT